MPRQTRVARRTRTSSVIAALNLEFFTTLSGNTSNASLLATTPGRHLAEGVDRMESGHQDKAMDQSQGETCTFSRPCERPDVLPIGLESEAAETRSFPVGEFAKHEVRSLAIDRLICRRRSQDSYGIASWQIALEDFLGHYIDDKHGDVCELETGEWNRFVLCLRFLLCLLTVNKQQKTKLYLSSLMNRSCDWAPPRTSLSHDWPEAGSWAGA